VQQVGSGRIARAAQARACSWQNEAESVVPMVQMRSPCHALDAGQ